MRSQVENFNLKDSLFTQEIRTEDFSKDTANPLSHQVMASSNFFSSTQTVAPIGNMMLSLVPRRETETKIDIDSLQTSFEYIHVEWKQSFLKLEATNLLTSYNCLEECWL